MTAYYNENDPFNVAWLRNLIAANLIAPGVVDERDIRDVKPYELAPFTQHHFFAGVGGWSLALRSAGWSDNRKVWTGSAPCQPFSQAGRRSGFADERHLWPFWRHLIRVNRPPTVFGEQVASASDWLRLVRGDLEALDYAVGAVPVEAASAGADHLRDRFWFVADDEHAREGRRRVQRPGEGNGASPFGASGEFAGPGSNGVGMAHSSSTGLALGERDRRVQQEALGASEGQDLADAGDTLVVVDDTRDGRGEGRTEHAVWGGGRAASEPSIPFERVIGADGKARRVKSGVRLLVDGFPNRVGLLRGFGNAIDPRPAAAFIKSYMGA